MRIYILRVGGRNLVGKNHSKVLLTLFLIEQRLQKSLVPRNRSPLRNLPVVIFIIVLSDPVFTD